MLYTLYINGNAHFDMGTNFVTLMQIAEKTASPATVADEHGDICFENEAQQAINNEHLITAKELLLYGDILVDEEYKINHSFYRTRLIADDNDVYVLKMCNGETVELFKI